MTEFRVNTNTTGAQSQPAITVLDNGDFVIAWSSNHGSTADDIYMQRFDSTGGALGSEILVNTYTTLNQQEADITTLANGNYLISWTDHKQNSNISTIYGQIFESDGDTVGSEFQISGSGGSGSSSIIGLSNGNVIVTWEGNDADASGVFGQIIEADGDAIGSAFQVNAYTTSSQARASAAALDNGGFVVTWHSLGQDGDGYGVYGQIYESDGDTVGSEFEINTTTANQQLWSNVTSLGNGNFVVTWYGDSNSEIYAQIYTNSGVAVGSELHINSSTTYEQVAPTVIALDYGNFLVTWESTHLGSGTFKDSIGRIFDANGNAISSEFQINTYTTHHQSHPEAAHLGNGKLAITWISIDQDGDSHGIYADIFDARNIVYDQTITGTSGNDTLQGSYGDDTITGLAGDDLIYGHIGADSLDGGADNDTVSYSTSVAAVTINLGTNSASGGDAQGDTIANFENVIGSSYNDSLTGSSSANSIVGGDGNDTLEGGAGADTLVGGNGMDTVSYAASGAAVSVDLSTNSFSGGDAASDVISGFENATGSGNNDTLTGSTAANLLDGGNGADSISGGDGTDSLKGGAGNDTLLGGNDNDTIYGDAGNDSIDGGAGDDTLTYINSTAAVAVNLGSGSGSAGDAATDSITSIEVLEGSVYNDTLLGSSSGEAINGNDGDDSIEGAAGADTLTGGNGTDTLSYANSGSAVTVNLSTSSASGGDAASDVISGFENIRGSSNADTLTGDGNANTIEGGAGADTLDGGAGSADAVSYANSSAAVSVNLSSNAVSGGHAASDVISNFENAIGSAFQDTLTGSSSANTLSGGADIDTIDGGGGNDYIDGGDGYDNLIGGTGVDTFSGGVGNDNIAFDSVEGAEIIDGGTGADSLNNVVGTLSSSRLSGGTGSGEIRSIEKFNIATGGSANLTFGAGYDDVANGYQTNTSVSVVGSSSGSLVADASALDVTTSLSGGINGDTLLGGTGNDTLIAGRGDDSVVGGNGNDTFITNELQFVSGDTLSGGSGTDTLLWDSAAAIASSELANKSGIDVIEFGVSGNTAVISQTFVDASDSDAVELDNNSVTITSLDTSGVGASYNVVIGGTGAVTLASGGNRVLAKDGINTSINGGSGADTILGGTGADTMSGAGGNDALTGGSGADVFDYNAATDSGTGVGTRDIISDFSQGSDIINLADVIGGTFSFIGTSAFSNANEVRYTIDAGNNRTVIEVDSDANGTANFEIELTGQITITGSDFVL